MAIILFAILSSEAIKDFKQTAYGLSFQLQPFSASSIVLGVFSGNVSMLSQIQTNKKVN